MASLIGALRVTLGMDSANFEAGMKRAQRQAATSASAISKSMGVIKAGITGFVSGLSVGLFVNAIKGALDYAGSLGEVSQQIGVTSRDLQVLRFAGGQVGVSTEEMDRALQKFTKSLGDARNGSEQAIKSFKAVGFTDEDIRRLDVHDALMKTADGIAAVSDRAARASPEVRLFGKAGQQLDPLLSQGSKGMNELANAAERLGIVLSDEQINKADETADKLEALKTVISANIAGAVANNSDAILALANSLVSLIASVGPAIRGWQKLVAVMSVPLHLNQNPFHTMSMAARAVDFRARLMAGGKGAPKPVSAGGGFGNFLAGGGGGGKSRAPKEDHSAERALTDKFRFDQDIRRAQMDALQAMRDLSTDAVERYTISIQIKDAEKAAYEAELAYEVELNKLTKGQQGLTEAQAAQLKAQYDIKDSLDRQKLIADEEARAYEDSVRLDQVSMDIQGDILESERAMATTAKERRALELKILDHIYEQERARLEAVIADKQSSDAAKEEARRRLAGLNQTYNNDRQGVMDNTRGPLEDFFSEVPKNAAQAQEAMERLQVMGIQGAIDSVLALGQGFESFKETAIRAVQAVIQELIRMQLMKLAFQLFGSAAGGAGGGMGALAGGFGSTEGQVLFGGGVAAFASGGSMQIGGKPGVDRNVLSMNGLPIARVSRGEMMHIVPDGKSMGGNHFNVNVSGAMSDRDARRTGMQIALAANQEMSRARQKGLG